MKVDKAPAIARLLKGPEAHLHLALFYGPDQGLVRERATELCKNIVPDLADPFNVTELSSDAVAADSARLYDEMAAQSLMGGRRLVRIRDAGEGITPALKALLADPPAAGSFLVIEAGELRPTSQLRKLCESAEQAAAVPCYVADERDLAKWCAEQLAASNVTASPDALALLAARLADDRGVARQEVEKIITYAGNSKKLDHTDIAAVIGNSAEAEMDEPAWAAGEGNLPELDRALDRLFQEGMSPVPILRATARHFTRLLEVVATPEPVSAAMEKLKPPVFWKDKDRFRRQASRWRAPELESALAQLLEAEAACKRTGLRDTTMAARALLRLGMLAGR